MKKILFLLVGCLLFLVSCGTNPTVSTTTTNPQTSTTTSVPSTTSTPEESKPSSGNMSEGGKYEDSIPWGPLQ